jgi:hypothetical protein
MLQDLGAEFSKFHSQASFAFAAIATDLEEVGSETQARMEKLNRIATDLHTMQSHTTYPLQLVYKTLSMLTVKSRGKGTKFPPQRYDHESTELDDQCHAKKINTFPRRNNSLGSIESGYICSGEER